MQEPLPFDGGVVFIEDNLDCCGQLLLKAFANRLTERVDSLFYCCVNESPNEATKHLSSPERFRVVLLDWSSDTPSVAEAEIEISAKIEAEIAKNCSIGVVIDSLSSFVLCSEDSPSSTADRLSLAFRRLTKGKKVVLLCLAHAELFAEDYERNRLMHSARSIYTLSLSHDGKSAVCRTAILKTKGKPVQKTESFDLITEPFAKVSAVSAYTKPTVEQLARGQIINSSSSLAASKAAEPTQQQAGLVGLSFNVGVSAAERRARDGVRLPYTDAKETGALVGAGGRAHFGGRVVYTPDADDDFDDSDPDDDLDV